MKEGLSKGKIGRVIILRGKEEPISFLKRLELGFVSMGPTVEDSVKEEQNFVNFSRKNV